MGRLLFFGFLIALMIFGIYWQRRQRIRAEQELETMREFGKTVERHRRKGVIKMCRCPECGTRFPETEAVMGAGDIFCSKECRDKAGK